MDTPLGKVKTTLEAVVGFAGNTEGGGVAYVRFRRKHPARVLRVPFRYRPCPALRDREVGYAALVAVSTVLQQRGIERVRFAVDDDRLVHDLRERSDLPAPLAVEYVRLRCALNQFRAYKIVTAHCTDGDLAARARLETAMRIAA